MKLGWLRSRKVLLLMGVGVLLALGASLLPLDAWANRVRQWLETLGIWAIPAFVLLYLIVTVLCLPNMILMLVAGTAFGLPLGIFSVSIADTVGAAVCYGLGRTIARNRVKRLMQRHAEFAHLDEALGNQGWKILLLTRLSPIVPSNILNYGFSCTKVNFWHYIFFTWIGMLPIIGLYVYVGYFGGAMLRQGASPQALAIQAVGLAIAVVAAIYTTRLAKSALSQKPSKSTRRQDAE
ncbi:TVP38/TMEM64 family protein [Oculatella sp. LEGE 06141]|uniref:TVP38/TMEM64 family protein n=1 Tax=Oculatella sp. LEGE 06141 TaxID=1828648 RepID=UPI0018807AE0|nr:TVP38/TMEM64 family protein [Oculatella sp. LEGE 06141]MBE9180419.1 TVP38/TMEM64 family protein [Oculatella sp. LEGE 06141]